MNAVGHMEESGVSHAWLALLRAPNLLTAPGDPLAGAALLATVGATPWNGFAVLLATSAALFLYASGLILNDCFDLKKDQQSRPERPLPHGNIPLRTAWTVGLLALLTGITLAFLAGHTVGLTALALATAIVLYDGPLKKTVLGPVVMGLCRGLSLLMGAAAMGWGPGRGNLPLLGAGIAVFYFACLTLAARHETETKSLGVYPVLITLAAALATLLIRSVSGAGQNLHPAILSAALAVLATAIIAHQLRGTPAPARVQDSIGMLIHAWILIQAAFCFTLFPMGSPIGMLLLFFWLTARLSASRISGS